MASIVLEIVRICGSQFKCNYLKSERLFLNVLFHFWNFHQIFNILKRKILIITNIFLNLKTAKDVVRQMSKKDRFGTLFDSQDGKGSEKLLKSAWEQFYHIFSSLWMKLIWNISPLVRYEILGAFVKTLTAETKYPPQLPKKQEAFSHFFVPFLK